MKLRIFVSIFIIGLCHCTHAGISLSKTGYDQKSKIDSLLIYAESLQKQELFNEALVIFEKIIEDSKSLNYSKGLSRGYIGAAASYYMQNKLDLSASYLAKSKEQSYTQKNPEILYTVYFWEGLNLHKLGLYDKAIEKYKQSISVLENVKEKSFILNKKLRALLNIGDIYQLKEEADSARNYYKTVYKSGATDTEIHFTSCLGLADLELDNGDLDSAYYYLNEASQYTNHVDSYLSLVLLYESLGKYYRKIGNLDYALWYYEESRAIYKDLKLKPPGLLKILSEIYQDKGDLERSNFYLTRYVALTDSLKKSNIDNLLAPLILVKTDSSIANVHSQDLNNIPFIILGLIFILTLFGILVYNRHQKKKRKSQSKENQLLKKRLNTAFDEVVMLAKNNSPNFISRFIEVYPEFYNHLNSQYPNLTNADIKLCALMRLDFSTKEIAEITFSSLRTVQNRKYKLRKKFGLSSDENINQWIQNLHIESLDKQ